MNRRKLVTLLCSLIITVSATVGGALMLFSGKPDEKLPVNAVDGGDLYTSSGAYAMAGYPSVGSDYSLGFDTVDWMCVSVDYANHRATFMRTSSVGDAVYATSYPADGTTNFGYSDGDKTAVASKQVTDWLADGGGAGYMYNYGYKSTTFSYNNKSHSPNSTGNAKGSGNIKNVVNSIDAGDLVGKIISGNLIDTAAYNGNPDGSSFTGEHDVRTAVANDQTRDEQTNWCGSHDHWHYRVIVSYKTVKSTAVSVVSALDSSDKFWLPGYNIVNQWAGNVTLPAALEGAWLRGANNSEETAHVYYYSSGAAAIGSPTDSKPVLPCVTMNLPPFRYAVSLDVGGREGWYGSTLIASNGGRDTIYFDNENKAPLMEGDLSKNEGRMTAFDDVSWNTPTLSGHSFGGYYTRSGGGGDQVITAAGGKGSGSVTSGTLYAKWIPNPWDSTIQAGVGGTVSGGVGRRWVSNRYVVDPIDITASAGYYVKSVGGVTGTTSGTVSTTPTQPTGCGTVDMSSANDSTAGAKRATISDLFVVSSTEINISIIFELIGITQEEKVINYGAPPNWDTPDEGSDTATGTTVISKDAATHTITIDPASGYHIDEVKADYPNAGVTLFSYYRKVWEETAKEGAENDVLPGVSFSDGQGASHDNTRNDGVTIIYGYIPAHHETKITTTFARNRLVGASGTNGSMGVVYSGNGVYSVTATPDPGYYVDSFYISSTYESGVNATVPAAVTDKTASQPITISYTPNIDYLQINAVFVPNGMGSVTERTKGGTVSGTIPDGTDFPAADLVWYSWEDDRSVPGTGDPIFQLNVKPKRGYRIYEISLDSTWGTSDVNPFTGADDWAGWSAHGSDKRILYTDTVAVASEFGKTSGHTNDISVFIRPSMDGAQITIYYTKNVVLVANDADVTKSSMYYGNNGGPVAVNDTIKEGTGTGRIKQMANITLLTGPDTNTESKSGHGDSGLFTALIMPPAGYHITAVYLVASNNGVFRIYNAANTNTTNMNAAGNADATDLSNTGIPEAVGVSPSLPYRVVNGYSGTQAAIKVTFYSTINDAILRVKIERNAITITDGSQPLRAEDVFTENNNETYVDEISSNYTATDSVFPSNSGVLDAFWGQPARKFAYLRGYIYWAENVAYTTGVGMADTYSGLGLNYIYVEPKPGYRVNSILLGSSTAGWVELGASNASEMKGGYPPKAAQITTFTDYLVPSKTGAELRVVFYQNKTFIERIDFVGSDGDFVGRGGSFSGSNLFPTENKPILPYSDNVDIVDADIGRVKMDWNGIKQYYELIVDPRPGYTVDAVTVDGSMKYAGSLKTPKNSFTGFDELSDRYEQDIAKSQIVHIVVYPNIDNMTISVQFRANHVLLGRGENIGSLYVDHGTIELQTQNRDDDTEGNGDGAPFYRIIAKPDAGYHLEKFMVDFDAIRVSQGIPGTKPLDDLNAEALDDDFAAIPYGVAAAMFQMKSLPDDNLTQLVNWNAFNPGYGSTADGYTYGSVYYDFVATYDNMIVTPVFKKNVIAVQDLDGVDKGKFYSYPITGKDKVNNGLEYVSVRTEELTHGTLTWTSNEHEKDGYISLTVTPDDGWRIAENGIIYTAYDSGSNKYGDWDDGVWGDYQDWSGYNWVGLSPAYSNEGDWENPHRFRSSEPLRYGVYVQNVSFLESSNYSESSSAVTVQFTPMWNNGVISVEFQWNGVGEPTNSIDGVTADNAHDGYDDTYVTEGVDEAHGTRSMFSGDVLQYTDYISSGGTVRVYPLTEGTDAAPLFADKYTENYQRVVVTPKNGYRIGDIEMWKTELKDGILGVALGDNGNVYAEGIYLHTAALQLAKKNNPNDYRDYRLETMPDTRFGGYSFSITFYVRPYWNNAQIYVNFLTNAASIAAADETNVRANNGVITSFGTDRADTARNSTFGNVKWEGGIEGGSAFNKDIYGGRAYQVTATPEPGYKFAGWAVYLTSNNDGIKEFAWADYFEDNTGYGADSGYSNDNGPMYAEGDPYKQIIRTGAFPVNFADGGDWVELNGARENAETFGQTSYRDTILQMGNFMGSDFLPETIYRKVNNLNSYGGHLAYRYETAGADGVWQVKETDYNKAEDDKTQAVSGYDPFDDTTHTAFKSDRTLPQTVYFTPQYNGLTLVAMFEILTPKILTDADNAYPIFNGEEQELLRPATTQSWAEVQYGYKWLIATQPDAENGPNGSKGVIGVPNLDDYFGVGVGYPSRNNADEVPELAEIDWVTWTKNDAEMYTSGYAKIPTRTNVVYMQENITEELDNADTAAHFGYVNGYRVTYDDIDVRNGDSKVIDETVYYRAIHLKSTDADVHNRPTEFESLITNDYMDGADGEVERYSDRYNDKTVNTKSGAYAKSTPFVDDVRVLPQPISYFFDEPNAGADQMINGAVSDEFHIGINEYISGHSNTIPDTAVLQNNDIMDDIVENNYTTIKAAQEREQDRGGNANGDLYNANGTKGTDLTNMHTSMATDDSGGTYMDVNGKNYSKMQNWLNNMVLSSGDGAEHKMMETYIDGDGNPGVMYNHGWDARSDTNVLMTLVEYKENKYIDYRDDVRTAIVDGATNMEVEKGEWDIIAGANAERPAEGSGAVVMYSSFITTGLWTEYQNNMPINGMVARGNYRATGNFVGYLYHVNSFVVSDRTVSTFWHNLQTSHLLKGDAKPGMAGLSIIQIGDDIQKYTGGTSVVYTQKYEYTFLGWDKKPQNWSEINETYGDEAEITGTAGSGEYAILTSATDETVVGGGTYVSDVDWGVAPNDEGNLENTQHTFGNEDRVTEYFAIYARKMREYSLTFKYTTVVNNGNDFSNDNYVAITKRYGERFYESDAYDITYITDEGGQEVRVLKPKAEWNIPPDIHTKMARKQFDVWWREGQEGGIAESYWQGNENDKDDSDNYTGRYTVIKHAWLFNAIYTPLPWIEGEVS